MNVAVTRRSLEDSEWLWRVQTSVKEVKNATLDSAEGTLNCKEGNISFISTRLLKMKRFSGKSDFHSHPKRTRKETTEDVFFEEDSTDGEPSDNPEETIEEKKLRFGTPFENDPFSMSKQRKNIWPSSNRTLKTKMMKTLKHLWLENSKIPYRSRFHFNFKAFLGVKN